MFGADSMIEANYETWPSGSPKIWTAGAGKYGIGFCGHLKWGDVLRYHVRWPTKTTELPRRLKACVQGALERTGYEITADDELLVGHQSQLYLIDCHMTVLPVNRDYAALGESDIANGVLHATKGWPPKKRVTAALNAAAEHSTGVRKPWTFLTI